ncbi:hypothetical protein WICPIJ_002477, partial [Wickerhamomyces pijperi]
RSRSDGRGSETRIHLDQITLDTVENTNQSIGKDTGTELNQDVMLLFVSGPAEPEKSHRDKDTRDQQPWQSEFRLTNTVVLLNKVIVITVTYSLERHDPQKVADQERQIHQTGDTLAEAVRRGPHRGEPDDQDVKTAVSDGHEDTQPENHRMGEQQRERSGEVDVELVKGGFTRGDFINSVICLLQKEEPNNTDNTVQDHKDPETPSPGAVLDDEPGNQRRDTRPNRWTKGVDSHSATSLIVIEQITKNTGTDDDRGIRRVGQQPLGTKPKPRYRSRPSKRTEFGSGCRRRHRWTPQLEKASSRQMGKVKCKWKQQQWNAIYGQRTSYEGSRHPFLIPR